MDVAIVGIGIHKFGRTDGVSGREQGIQAARNALDDAGVTWSKIEFAAGGSSAAGNADAVSKDLGLTGIPFVNVYNGCATGASSLTTACNAIQSGQAKLAMAIGFDKHPRGAFNAKPADWGIGDWYGETGLMLTTQFFALKIQRYMHEYGISQNTLAKVAAKAFDNGALNENAWRRTPVEEAEIESATMVNHPLTKYMFCSPSEGAVALILCSADDATKYTSKPVLVKAAKTRFRRYGTFEVFNPSIALDGTPSPTVDASRAAFEEAKLAPGDIDVIQIQDTESGAEVMHMAENGFCANGEQEPLIQSGATKIGSKMPINTDGGCLANGEPIGASGLRQIHECCVQLRGEAGARQVPGNPKTAYTHVYGAPGLSAVTILSN